MKNAGKPTIGCGLLQEWRFSSPIWVRQPIDSCRSAAPPASPVASRCRSQQIAHPNEVVGRHREGHIPIHLREGNSQRAIAKKLGVHRDTVRRVWDECVPRRYSRPRRPSRLDSFVEHLKARLTAYPGMCATRLYREIRQQGFTAGYEVVKRWCRRWRREERAGQATVRFETPPGLQAQADRGESRNFRFSSGEVVTRASSPWCWRSQAALRGVPAAGDTGVAAVGPHAGLRLLPGRAAAHPLRQSQAAREATAARPGMAGTALGVRIPLRLPSPGVLAGAPADQGQGRERGRRVRNADATLSAGRTNPAKHWDRGWHGACGRTTKRTVRSEDRVE